ncbi:glycosyltransferase family 4 protein [bacterium]|nr:glycosyltransferase family 4 protein [bacterium]
MKVLMFGWEFPPFISGGLGPACYGITRGLLNNGVDVTFVIPTRKNKDISDPIRIICADEVPIMTSEIPMVEDSEQYISQLKMLGIENRVAISPYVTTMLKALIKDENQEKIVIPGSKLTRGSVLAFTGEYGDNLLQEVVNYGLVGGSIPDLQDYDVIHAHDWLTYFAGIQAKVASGKPLIVHVHATEFDRSGENMNQEVYNIEKSGMEIADKIIAVSHYTKNIIIKYYGIDPGKIEVVYNAVNKEKQLERYKMKKNVDEKIVLFLGRVTMQKGPEYFINAANLVLKRMKNVRFVMAGSGDMLPRMISRMAELKIADRFHFTGFLRGMEVEKMYAISDLYVMPSVSEPFGLTPFEALLYDVPIIISRQSGAAELLKNAIILDFWDVRKLADIIVAILKNEELARNIVEACKDEIKNIGWNNAGARIKDIYRNILNSKV